MDIGVLKALADDTRYAVYRALASSTAALSAQDLADRLGVPCPIIAEVRAMLYAGKEPRHAVADLLGRDSKAEG